MSTESVFNLSYPDFVALINQKNTPPGADLTIKTWINQGRISNQSHILDLACTTGYSSRRITSASGCSAIGIDISSDAIKIANKERKYLGIKNLTYITSDACTLPFGNSTFTHILGGCNFSFIQERERALEECSRVLGKNGILCISSFYYKKAPPSDMLSLVGKAIGFTPNPNWTYDYWNAMFSQRFQKDWEQHHDLPIASEEMLQESIEKQIFNDDLVRKIGNKEVLQACFERLHAIRQVLNEHRRYQKFCIQIWRKS